MPGDGPVLALTQQHPMFQVEAKYPALLFKQQLDAFVQKIFPILRDNVKKEITPQLAACIHAPRQATARNRRTRDLGSVLSGDGPSTPGASTSSLLHQTAHAPAPSLLLLNVMRDAAAQRELVAFLSTAALWTALSFASNSSSRSVDVASCQCKPIGMARCEGPACA